MRTRALLIVPACWIALCCTVPDRELEIVSDTGGTSSAGSDAGGSANDAGASVAAGENSGGTRATGGSQQGGTAQGGTAGTAGNSQGDAGMPTMSEGGAGEFPLDQGTSCALPPPTCYGDLAQPSVGGDALIDDFEDGDYCAKQHMRGYWFPYGAGTPHMLMSSQGHNSAHALQLSGDEHAGVALRPNGSQGCDEEPFDLSSYVGVKFWARVVTGNVEVNVAGRDAGTESGGGEFNTTPTSPPVVISKTWQQLTVPFNTMKDSNLRVFDPSTTTILKLQAPTIDPPSFVMLFDEVTFY
jgi:hypothetical protein